MQQLQSEDAKAAATIKHSNSGCIRTLSPGFLMCTLCRFVLATVTCAALCCTPGRYISLLRLLRLGRVYRLYTWVQLMTYNQTFSLLAVTLVRNFAVREQRQRQAPTQQKRQGTACHACCVNPPNCKRPSLVVDTEKAVVAVPNPVVAVPNYRCHTSATAAARKQCRWLVSGASGLHAGRVSRALCHAMPCCAVSWRAAAAVLLHGAPGCLRLLVHCQAERVQRIILGGSKPRLGRHRHCCGQVRAALSVLVLVLVLVWLKRAASETLLAGWQALQMCVRVLLHAAHVCAAALERGSWCVCVVTACLLRRWWWSMYWSIITFSTVVGHQLLGPGAGGFERMQQRPVGEAAAVLCARRSSGQSVLSISGLTLCRGNECAQRRHSCCAVPMHPRVCLFGLLLLTAAGLW